MSVIDQTKQMMQATLDHYKQELKNLRSNRANPGMLDNVQVEVYGSQMRLRDVANVTAPEARQLLITPFDPQTAGSISKGIEKANLNLQPMLDGHVVRINVPPMDESMRKEIVKQAKKKGEDSKIVLREVRRKNNETARKQKADNLMTEDVLKKTEKTIQELTDQYCRDIDALFTTKEKEVLTV